MSELRPVTDFEFRQIALELAVKFAAGCKENDADVTIILAKEFERYLKGAR